MKQVLKRAFNLRGDTASYEEIQERILGGGEVRGTNLCILILAIFIASIGLNMNSTAVVIGAMLISPLMGGIMAIAYGFATADLRQARNSALGLLVQVLTCLVISTLYFALSPIKTPSAEIIARTSPTIWDVMIACFGGLAGIIGITRKEKSNVIPGVAIATALMPPLCTAGYGIAHGSLKFFAGAIYLFIINSYFICLTSLIVLLILNVPKRSAVALKPEVIKRLKRKIIQNSIVLIIPSVLFGYQMVMQEMSNATANYDSDQAIFNVERTTKELQIIFPEITGMKVGYMDQYDSESEKEYEELLAIVYIQEELDPEKQEKIEHWLKLEYNLDEVNFYFE